MQLELRRDLGGRGQTAKHASTPQLGNCPLGAIQLVLKKIISDTNAALSPLTETPPPSMCHSRVMLVLKLENVTDPSQQRLISVSLVLLHCLHSEFPSQFVFQAHDGCLEATTSLHALCCNLHKETWGSLYCQDGYV